MNNPYPFISSGASISVLVKLLLAFFVLSLHQSIKSLKSPNA